MSPCPSLPSIELYPASLRLQDPCNGTSSPGRQQAQSGANGANTAGIDSGERESYHMQ